MIMIIIMIIIVAIILILIVIVILIILIILIVIFIVIIVIVIWFTLRKFVQVTRAGLYSEENDLAGMNEAHSDDSREPDWAPAADANSPDYYGDLGDVAGGKKLQSSKKRARGMSRNFY
jgi:flagellar basal body-associated protein FliL